VAVVVLVGLGFGVFDRDVVVVVVGVWEAVVCCARRDGV
jgi:hypothetical protein